MYSGNFLLSKVIRDFRGICLRQTDRRPLSKRINTHAIVCVQLLILVGTDLNQTAACRSHWVTDSLHWKTEEDSLSLRRLLQRTIAVCFCTSLPPLPTRLCFHIVCVSISLYVSAPTADYMNNLRCVNPRQLLFPSCLKALSVLLVSPVQVSGEKVVFPRPRHLSLPVCLPVSVPGVKLCLAVCLLSLSPSL